MCHNWDNKGNYLKRLWLTLTMLSTAYFLHILKAHGRNPVNLCDYWQLKHFPYVIFGKWQHKKTKTDLTSKMLCYRLVAQRLKQLHSNVVQRNLKNTYAWTNISVTSFNFTYVICQYTHYANNYIFSGTAYTLWWFVNIFRPIQHRIRTA